MLAVIAVALVLHLHHQQLVVVVLAFLADHDRLDENDEEEPKPKRTLLAYSYERLDYNTFARAPMPKETISLPIPIQENQRISSAVPPALSILLEFLEEAKVGNPL